MEARGQQQATEKAGEKAEEIAREVADGTKKVYQAIEKGVVSGYKAIKNGVVEGFDKITDKFVGTFLTKEGETVEQAKMSAPMLRDLSRCAASLERSHCLLLLTYQGAFAIGESPTETPLPLFPSRVMITPVFSSTGPPQRTSSLPIQPLISMNPNHPGFPWLLFPPLTTVRLAG